MLAGTGNDTALVGTYATVIVALIAGVFSLLGLVIAKEQKVSEFRQEWIDELRNDTAEFIAQANIIHAALVKLYKQPDPDKVKFLEDNRDNYLSVNRSSSRIRLRLNIEECPSLALLEAVRGLEGLLVRELEKWVDSDDQLRAMNVGIEDKAGKVLKEEWDRVKSGERQYVVAKWSAVVLAGICLLMIALAIAGARLHGFGA